MTPPSLHDQARAALDANRLQDACALYLQAWQAEPADLAAACEATALLLELGGAEQALQVVREVRGQGLQDPQLEALEAAALRQAAASLPPAEAEARLREACRREPQDATLQANLGLALSRQGRHADAEPVYRSVLALKPDDAATLSNLGATLVQLGRDAEAEPCLRRALELQPRNFGAASNLGVVLNNTCRAPEARAAFRLAAAGDDTSIGLHLKAHLTLSPIIHSEADIVSERAAYAEGLEVIAAAPRRFQCRANDVNLPWFYLAYHGRNDAPLVRRTAEVLADRVEHLAHVAPHVEAWRGPPGGRIRVAFVSSFFRDHSIGRMYQNVLRGLDRRRFEVVLVHGPSAVRDAFSQQLEDAADGVLILRGDLPTQHDLMRRVAPDVIFYPDIGMAADTYFLAHARLAPVQAVTGGHPETPGLASLDYYLSCDAVEPPNPHAHYVERLIQLDRLPVFMNPPAPFAVAPTREELGLPASGALYGCPHTLFKFHPDFDRVLARICELDPTGWIVAPAADREGWTEALKARWRRDHPILAERAVWIPRVPRDVFVSQLSRFDVLLDPLHFGSGQTLYLAMNAGTPMLSCPGEFGRGRVVLAAYRQMGAGDELLVDDVSDYADRAFAVAHDPERRRRLVRELHDAAAGALFNDDQAIRSMERFFEDSVEVAAAGRKLPTDWRP